MSDSAATEGIDNPATKASTAYKYDVLWGTGDKIIVKGQNSSDTFTLTGGAGTTVGTFKQDNAVALSGEVESFYPVSEDWARAEADGAVCIIPNCNQPDYHPYLYWTSDIGNSGIYHLLLILLRLKLSDKLAHINMI